MIKKIVFSVALSLFSLCLSAQNVDDLLESGNQKIKERDFKSAVGFFKSALEQSPAHMEALNGAIRACTLAGDYKEAQKYVDIAVEQYPQNAEFVMRHGILLNYKGNHDGAIEQFEKGLAMNPDSRLHLQFLLNKGAAELNSSNFTDAVEDYNKAIELDPRNTSIYTSRGLANYRAGNIKEAIDDYTNAIDLDPTLAHAYYNRGVALLKMEDRRKACADFQKACQGKVTEACKMIMLECRK